LPLAGCALLRSEGLAARTWYRDGRGIGPVEVLRLEALERVEGPAFLEDAYTTIAVPPGATARRDHLGGIVLEVAP